MRIEWAGLYEGSNSEPYFGQRESKLSITEIDVSTAAPTDVVLFVAYSWTKDPEDHPDLAAMASMVLPSGATELIGGGGALGYSPSGAGSSAIQAIRFRENGAHRIEIRPWMVSDAITSASMLPPIAPAGERVLASLPLFVTGVRLAD